MQNFYCEYCGRKFLNVTILTASNCERHPLGTFNGKHKLYEGSEKTQYICKYCGKKFQSIAILSACNCERHPNGTFKGKHSPAL